MSTRQTGAFALRLPGGPGWTARKVLAVSAAMASNRLAYAGEVLTRMVFLSIILFTIASLWRTVGQHQDLVATTGYDLVQLVWYLAFAEALLSSGPSLPAEALEIDREVRSGDIAYRLVRPLPYVLYHLGSYLGFRLVNLALLAGPLFGVTALLVGVPAFSKAAVLAAVLAGVVAMAVDGTWSFALSMTAFWVEDTYGLHLLYRRCLMLLGGLLVPIDAYPDWLRAIAEVLPFRSILYGPAKLFVQGNADGLGELLVQQGLFLAAGLVPLVVLYRLGMRRVSANGG